jgi:hypothetical protein
MKDLRNAVIVGVLAVVLMYGITILKRTPVVSDCLKRDGKYADAFLMFLSALIAYLIVAKCCK